MKNILLKLLLLTSIMLSFGASFSVTFAEEVGFTQLSTADKGTFNEYRYLITREYFKLREVYEIDGVIDSKSASNILSYATSGYKYLPDNLINEDNFNTLSTNLQKGIKYPNSESTYTAIRNALTAYVDKAEIETIEGVIEADPIKGNAPLVSTFRARVEDPSGTRITDSSYTWWMDVAGSKKIIGTKPSIAYNFVDEGSYTVFLDVKSSHKNSKGYTDVLPFTGKIQVQVEEKMASVILRIGSNKLDEDDEVKFSPEEARYGITFDATSSVPTTGTKFLETRWDFGNGVITRYSGSPKIERVVYANEGDYNVILQLKTNQGFVITKRFTVLVHNPAATINSNQSEGFIGDQFTFRAVSSSKSNNNLIYNWEIIDLSIDEVILSKGGTLLQYEFLDKGRYSIRLKITDAAGETDYDTQDIYINSRPPVASISLKTPLSNKPNQIFLDATNSYDPDYTDDGKLKYSWTIDGEKINLFNPNADGSTGYYTFDTIGQHSIALEVEDPDGIITIAKQNVAINSVLSVDFSIYPRVVQREGVIRFISDSPDAQFYEWSFGDGGEAAGITADASHAFNESGIFTVTLTVRGQNKSESNSVSKLVYIGNSKNPVALIELSQKDGFDFVKESAVCSGNDAYIISRADNITFSSSESIDTNGQNTGLSVSWKIGVDKYATSTNLSYKFDELGCFPVRLNVKSLKDKTVSEQTVWVKVENMKPTISGLTVTPVDINSDPVVVNVAAVGARDIDGVIQSYLWYYTTDADSEAQDFRVTTTPSTTFVLPKIPGNYYFGVVLKDNNEDKVISEDVIGRTAITLTGDNVNTPLIDFTTNDSSVSIGESVEFNADAKNILGKSIEKTATYSWDFDGDGFYDQETNDGSVSYSYTRSGEFYAKVKVKNKGFSNTRTIAMNVANPLVSEFGYISIGNKYVFLDTSKGTVDSQNWDLGDGTTKQNTSEFIHEYSDNKSVHQVELAVAEGTKVKKTTQTVTKDVRNIVKARQNGLNAFTLPAVGEDGKITIDNEESVFVYMGESRGDFTTYGIDYDIDNDSDVNGGKDDDVDNVLNLSYKTGEPEQIILNGNRVQTIRLFLLDTELNVIDSKDITIVKTYIEEVVEINPDDLVLEGVTDSIREKFEQLKESVSEFDPSDRVKGMAYVQKIQENWSDKTEKTKAILEFEEFLAGTGLDGITSTIELLESLLVEGEDDKSEKNIAYQALQALLPQDIQCETEGESCAELLTDKLTQIKESTDIEANRAIGSEILLEIGTTSLLTEKEKNDFKAILKVLVYSGLDNIPEDEVDEIIAGNEATGTGATGDSGEISSDDNKLMAFLKKIGVWAAGIFGGLLIVMFIIWIIDFFKNRKSGESFEDFVTEKTNDDILADSQKKSSDPLSEGKEEKTTSSLFSSEVSDPVKVDDVTAEVLSQPTSILENNVQEEKVDDGMDIFGEEDEEEEKPLIEKKEVIDKNEITPPQNVEEGSIPSWLAGAAGVKSDKNTSKDPIMEEKKEVSIIPENEGFDDDSFDLEEETKIDDNTPDWLKESMVEKIPEKTSDAKLLKEVKEESLLSKKDDTLGDENDEDELLDGETEEVIIQDPEEAIDLENDIPDWLKGTDGFGTSKKDDVEIDAYSDEDKITNTDSDDDFSFDLEDSKNEFSLDRSNESSNQDDEIDLFGDESQEDILSDIEEPIVESEPEPEIKSSDDNIPDWLRGSLEDDTKKQQEKKIKEDAAKNSVTEKEDVLSEKFPGHNSTDTKLSGKKSEHLKDINVPDWLKDSLTEESFENIETEKHQGLNEKGDSVSEKTVEENSIEKIPESKVIKKKVPKKVTTKKISNKSEEENSKKEEKKDRSSELWDDGMKVPDWLKNDD